MGTSKRRRLVVVALAMAGLALVPAARRFAVAAGLPVTAVARAILDERLLRVRPCALITLRPSVQESTT